MKLFAFLLFNFWSVLVCSQTIINIESKRIITDTLGWAGSARLGVNIIKNTSEQFNGHLNTHLQYKTQKNLYLLVVGGAFLNADDRNFINDGTVHLRFNTKVNPWLRWEAFSQIQYNQVLNISHRSLIGTGPRFKLKSSKKLRVYTATLYMFEHQEISNPLNIENNHRLSTYLSFNWEPTSTFNISSTSYFQPLIDDFSNHRISSEIEFSFKISKRISFSSIYMLLTNTHPAKGIPKTNYTLRNGLSFQLGN